MIASYCLPSSVIDVYDPDAALLSIGDGIGGSAGFAIEESEDKTGVVYHPDISLLIASLGERRAYRLPEIGCHLDGAISLLPLCIPSFLKIGMGNRAE